MKIKFSEQRGLKLKPLTYIIKLIVCLVNKQIIQKSEDLYEYVYSR